MKRPLRLQAVSDALTLVCVAQHATSATGHFTQAGSDEGKLAACRLAEQLQREIGQTRAREHLAGGEQELLRDDIPAARAAGAAAREAAEGGADLPLVRQIEVRLDVPAALLALLSAIAAHTRASASLTACSRIAVLTRGTAQTIIVYESSQTGTDAWRRTGVCGARGGAGARAPHPRAGPPVPRSGAGRDGKARVFGGTRGAGLGQGVAGNSLRRARLGAGADSAAPG